MVWENEAPNTLAVFHWHRSVSLIYLFIFDKFNNYNKSVWCFEYPMFQFKISRRVLLNYKTFNDLLFKFLTFYF